MRCAMRCELYAVTWLGLVSTDVLGARAGARRLGRRVAELASWRGCASAGRQAAGASYPPACSGAQQRLGQSRGLSARAQLRRAGADCWLVRVCAQSAVAAADQLDRSGAGDQLPELAAARPLAAFLRREAEVAAQLAEAILSHHLETVEAALANYRALVEGKGEDEVGRLAAQAAASGQRVAAATSALASGATTTRTSILGSLDVVAQLSAAVNAATPDAAQLAAAMEAAVRAGMAEYPTALQAQAMLQRLKREQAVTTQLNAAIRLTEIEQVLPHACRLQGGAAHTNRVCVAVVRGWRRPAKSRLRRSRFRRRRVPRSKPRCSA